MLKGKIIVVEILIIIYFIILSSVVWGYDVLWRGFKDLFLTVISRRKERHG